MYSPTQDLSQPADPRQTRVALIDDHPLIRDGLKALLQEQGMMVCVEAGSAAAAIPAVASAQPDLIILDVSLPDGDGFSLIRTLRQTCAGARILMMSAQEETLYAHLALEHGAQGYVSKGMGLEELLDAVRQVEAGETYTSARMKRLGPTKQEVTKTLAGLSLREMELFQHLAVAKSNQEIARNMGITEKTVRYHRSKMNRKLGLNSPGELMQQAKCWHQLQQSTVPSSIAASL